MMRLLFRVLTFPLQATVLAAIVVLVSLSWLAGAAGLFGIFLFICIATAFVHLSFLVYRVSAMGRRDVPVLGTDEFSPAASAAPWYALLLAASVAAGYYFVSRQAGPLAAGAFGLGVVCVAPASLALLVLNGSLAQALSPVHVGRMIVAMGKTYAAMPAIVLAAGGTLALAARVLPGWLASLVGAYAWFVALHALGRVVNAHRDRIGLEAVNPDTLRAGLDRRQATKERNDMLDVAFQEARTDSARALEVIEGWLAGSQAPADARRWAFERARAWPNSNVAVQLAVKLVDEDLAAGNDTAALDAAAWSLAANPRFRPAGADATLRLAQAAQRGGRPRVLTRILSDFAERFPADPRSASASLTCARVALEKTNESGLARTALAHLGRAGRLREDPRVARLRAMLDEAGPGRG